MEAEETIGLSAQSPQFETNNIEPQNPRKRKRIATHDESAEADRARLKRSQYLNLQQASIWVSISKLRPVREYLVTTFVFRVVLISEGYNEVYTNLGICSRAGLDSPTSILGSRVSKGSD